MNATDLMTRVIVEIERQGLKCAEQNYSTYTEHNVDVGTVYLFIEQTYRHNGTNENVTVKIECCEITTVYSDYCWRTKRRGDIIKVPKNASDKVIRNRVEKAISLMK